MTTKETVEQIDILKHNLKIHTESVMNQISELEKIIDKPEVTKEQRFIELTNNLVRKTDYLKYPKALFFFSLEGKLIIEQDYKNGYVYINYERIWSILETEFRMNYGKIQAFIKDMLEEHFKCKGLTPICGVQNRHFWLEEHFKCKGLTPQQSF